MKRIAFMALHYGVEYLRWSLRSIRDEVDEIHIHYSPVPTCGWPGKRPPPDNREWLHQEARGPIIGFGPKLVWFDHPRGFRGYGPHCDAGVRSAMDAGADLIVNVDADEVWAPGALSEGFRNMLALRGTPAHMQRYRVPFVHFWRSFRFVCTDPAQPVRFIDPIAHQRTHGHVAIPTPVLHFGYAQSEELTAYKWEIHGHRKELRPRWFEEKFLGWKPGVSDVHPTCGDNFWDPKPVDEALARIVESVLHDHPYRGVEIIR